MTRRRGDKPRPTITISPTEPSPESLSTRGSISPPSPARTVSTLHCGPTWAAVGERRDVADRLPDDGLAGELVEVAGQSAVLVTFPVANHAAEAFFALVAPLEPPESHRYLTLEFSWNVVTDHPLTVIGEWRAGSHVNLGPGTEAARSTFPARMEELLNR